MDRYGGSFGAYDDAFGDVDPFGFDDGESADDHAPLAPFSPVGQDERRMQVRAYNHWAGLLGDADLPDIADLDLEALGDFGPNGILLDFSGKRGVDDPAIRYLGEKLALECGTDATLKRLSNVPGRSLLSRITDHYLQILANRAPIGFEAEFTNHEGAQILYRGILLPWSSDGTTIDFVFGVINWKELADAEVTARLLSAIDGALAAPIPPYEGKEMDRMLDLSGFAAETGTDHEPAEAARDLPTPTFGLSNEPDHANPSPLDLIDEFDDENDEDSREATEWGAGFSGFGDEDTVYSVDYGDQGLEDGAEDEDCGDVVDPLADSDASFGLASLVSRSSRVKQSVVLPGMEHYEVPAEVPVYSTLEERIRAALTDDYDPGVGDDEPFELRHEFEDSAGQAEDVGLARSRRDGIQLARDFDADESAPPPLGPEAATQEAPVAFDEAEPEGLYDCLAAARELAQTARFSEDRGRKALYQAVARAYDFSLEAAANPADFDELLSENGLTVQDRAPMTPIVKLVFGADYDKTRLTEYATVLGYAHRAGVARGALDTVLARTEGGLKGLVQAERRARREAEGKATPVRDSVRDALARKLRKLEAIALDDLASEGAEFALVMIRRLPSGEFAVIGEVPDDVPLIEKAARRILG